MSLNINNLGFMFKMADIKVRCNKTKKIKNNYKVIKPDVLIIHLTKNNFTSCTFDISTNKDEAWKAFEKYILELYRSYISLSLRKDKQIYSFLCQFVKIKKCEDCDSYNLYLKYNVIPFINNDQSNICLPKYAKFRDCSGNVLPSNYIYDDNNEINKLSAVNNNSFINICSDLYFDLKFFIDSNYGYLPVCLQ
jgi:hypothetical protein